MTIWLFDSRTDKEGVIGKPEASPESGVGLSTTGSNVPTKALREQP